MKCHSVMMRFMRSDHALDSILEDYRSGKLETQEVKSRLASAWIGDIGYAQVDHQRTWRQGAAEVVFGQGKTAAHLVGIVRELLKVHGRVLVTRVDARQAGAITRQFPSANYHKEARLVRVERKKIRARSGRIVVVSAGTSDFPVAMEATLTAEFLGNDVVSVRDAGVAGLHRLLAQIKVISEADVIIVVAGMEGALPSVVAGLVSKPVIAVPTSVGYGASFNGLAALLGMLNSCGSGVTVVNIDNGFGAAFAANQITGLLKNQVKVDKP